MPYPKHPTGIHGVQIVNIVFLILNLALFFIALNHVSSEPQLLARYSYAYAGFLFFVGLVLSLQLWLWCCASQRMLRFAENIYLMIVTTLIVVAVTEFLLRKFNPWGINFFHNLPYHMQGMVDHPELGYVHPHSVTYQLGENTVNLNSKGMRDKEVDFNKSSGEKRILVLGDSVTFGWGVDQGETFSDQMEPLLHKLTGHRWEVINSGVNGYNTEQEATFLNLMGLRFDPDIVILVYVVNDTEPVFDPNETTWRRYPSWPTSLPEAINRLRQQSYIFQISKLFLRMNKFAALQAAEKSQDSIVDKTGWAESKMALKAISDQLKQKKIPFLVARNSGLDKKFVDELGILDIEVMMLNSAWQEIPSQQAHVSRIDPHPSADVHARMAVHIVQKLTELGWVADGDLSSEKK